MKDQINPNVLAYEPSPGKMTELFQSGPGGDRGVGHRARVASFANTGFPVDFVYPKEGALTLLAAAVRSPSPTPRRSRTSSSRR